MRVTEERFNGIFTGLIKAVSPEDCRDIIYSPDSLLSLDSQSQFTAFSCLLCAALSRGKTSCERGEEGSIIFMVPVYYFRHHQWTAALCLMCQLVLFIV